MTCVYPTRDSDVAQKPPTLRDISNRLELLESLLTLLVQRSGVPTASVAKAVDGRARGDAEPEIPVQSRPTASNTRTGRHHPSDPRSDNATWELLLNPTNLEPLLQEEKNKATSPLDLETTPSNHQLDTASHHKLPTQLGAPAPPDTDLELLNLYPDTQLALRLWNVYVKSVDPVVKILHIPTVQSAVVATILNTRSAQPSTVALTFAIYYAAVTALCHDDCDEPVELPWEKLVLLKRYQTALDRLLVGPDFINRPDVTGLQALAIYVVRTKSALKPILMLI